MLRFWRHGFVKCRCSCFFGDLEVTASTQSSSRVTCAAPISHSKHVVSLVVSNFAFQIEGAQRLPFRYMDRFDVSSLAPSSGPVGGGATVRVSATGMIQKGEQVRCVFGKLSVLASVLRLNTIACASPSRMRYGNVSFHLSRDGLLSEASGLMFEYESSGVVLEMEPRSGPVQGGTEVTIIGQSLRKRGMLHCHFGSEVVMARALDSSRVTCSSPRRVLGRVTVDVYDDSGRLSGQGLAFEYKTAILLTAYWTP